MDQLIDCLIIIAKATTVFHLLRMDYELMNHPRESTSIGPQPFVQNARILCHAVRLKTGPERLPLAGPAPTSPALKQAAPERKYRYFADNWFSSNLTVR